MARSGERDGLPFLQLLLILPIMSLWIWKDVPYYAEQLLSLTSQREEVKMMEFISSVWPCSVSELLLVKDLGLSHHQKLVCCLANNLHAEVPVCELFTRPPAHQWHCQLATDWLEACNKLGEERSAIANLFSAKSAPDGRTLKLVLDFVHDVYD